MSDVTALLHRVVENDRRALDALVELLYLGPGVRNAPFRWTERAVDRRILGINERTVRRNWESARLLSVALSVDFRAATGGVFHFRKNVRNCVPPASLRLRNCLQTT